MAEQGEFVGVDGKRYRRVDCGVCGGFGRLSPSHPEAYGEKSKCAPCGGGGRVEVRHRDPVRPGNVWDDSTLVRENGWRLQPSPDGVEILNQYGEEIDFVPSIYIRELAAVLDAVEGD